MFPAAAQEHGEIARGLEVALTDPVQAVGQVAELVERRFAVPVEVGAGEADSGTAIPPVHPQRQADGEFLGQLGDGEFVRGCDPSLLGRRRVRQLHDGRGS